MLHCYKHFSIIDLFCICNSTMATRRERVLVSLVDVLVLKYILLSFKEVLLTSVNQSLMMMLFLISEANTRPRSRSLWRYGRVKGFVQRHFISGQAFSFSPQMIKVKLRLSYDTFVYLCEVLRPMLQRGGTRMELGIDVKTQVVVTLSRLSTGNTLRMCGEMYDLAESTTSIIVRECCEAIKVLVKPLVFSPLTKEHIQIIASKFEKVRDIPYIIGIVNGSHVPIIDPKIDPPSYYCRKYFYSALLQGVVDSKCLFWDFDFGWAGSNHDWSVFQRTEIGKKFLQRKFKPYKLIGDAPYPMRHCFILQFKGSKSGLSREKRFWNFIQSSTKMVIE